MKYRKVEILLGSLRRPDLVVRYLRGKQPSEFDLAEVAKYVKSASPTVVEAGAFDGRDTVAFSNLWPKGHVYAFEPLPTLANKLRCATLKEVLRTMTNRGFAFVACRIPARSGNAIFNQK